MPLPFFSTDGLFGGAYSRMRGLILSGELGSTNAGPISPVGGIAVIQPALACSTAGPAAQILSTVQATFSAGNFVYVPQTSAGFATSSFAAAEVAPSQTGMGAALVFQAATKKIGVYSTVSGSGIWYFSAAMTSSA